MLLGFQEDSIMRRKNNLKIVLLLLAVLAGNIAWAAPDGPAAGGKAISDPATVTPDYRIGSGDVLQINVWKEPEASVPAAVVRSDGRISVPLLKDVEVQGLTTAEVEKRLTEKFVGLIPGADVTVLVRETRSKKVYLLGAVKREGPLMLVGPLTVLQAIAEAGGFTDFAKPKKIYVIRPENGRQVRLPFDYEAVIKGLNPEKDLPLMANDVVYIPK